MFKNLTYKQKFYVVIGGFVLLTLACYKKTYKQVLSARTELISVERKLASDNTANNDIYNLKNDIALLDNIIGGHASNPKQIQRLIFDFVSQKGPAVNFVSMDDVHVYSNAEFLIYTNQLELEGSYEDLMILLYDIEKNFTSSRVVSNAMYSKQNYTKNTTKLYLKIILQNYEKV